MSTSSNRLVAIFGVIILVLAAVAIAGWMRSVEEVTEEIPVELSLEDMAKLEGKVTVYSAVDVPDFENVIKPAFLEVYPWAKVEYVGMDPGDVAARTIAEYKAGKVTADVLMNSLSSLTLVIDEGAAQNFENPMIKLMDYPEGTFDPEGYWHPSAQFPIVIAYNTNLVDPDDAPKSYTDLADPKWKGKITFEDPSAGGEANLLFATLYPAMDNETWTDLMLQIADQDVLYTSSGGDVFQNVAMGAAEIGICMANDILSMPEGTPVAVSWIEPAYAMIAPALVTKDAPHPAMARLFVEWLSSASGEYAFAATGRVPVHPAIAATTLLEGFVPTGIEIMAAGFPNQDYMDNPGEWNELFRTLFRT